jgi:HEAT repeat protein
MELAKAIGMMEPDASMVQKLDALIRDDSPEVSRYAIDSAGRLGREEHINTIVSRLNNPFVQEDAVSALKRYGAAALPAMEKRLRDSKVEMGLRSALVTVLARIGSQEAFDILTDELEGKPEELESQIIDALDRIRSEHANLHVHEKAAKRKTQDLIRRYCRSFIALDELEVADENRAEIKMLKRKLDSTLMNIFKLLGLYYPREDISKAYQNLKTGTKDSRAFAVELLDNTLRRDVRDVILPMIEQISPDVRVRRFRQILRNL